MTSSFICENCGIKVSASVGTECPGCGQSSDNSSNPTPETQDYGSSLQDSSNLFNRKNNESQWVINELTECEVLFDKELSYADQPEVLREVIRKLESSISSAPDAESSNRIHAYKSEMHRLSLEYAQSIEAAKVGVNSTEQFFKFQSHNAMLDSLLNLERLDDFNAWIEKSFEDKFIDANYYKIKYLTHTGKFDEALELCDSHYASDLMMANSNRSEVLVKAKRFEEAEMLLRKMVDGDIRGEYASNWANTLAFSILMPQGRNEEAERVLISVLCTTNQHEKTNAYSNLAIASLNMGEFSAAKRYASIASKHPQNSIASESRLTLCRIEYQRLLKAESHDQQEWKQFFDQVKSGLAISDMDDSAAFLELLIAAAPEAHEEDEIVRSIEDEFTRLKGLLAWSKREKARTTLQVLRVNELAKRYLQEKNYLKLDDLFKQALAELPNESFISLLDYLQTPFAAMELRRAALQVTDVRFLAQWAAFETQEEILFALAKNIEEPILVALAENPATPEAACELIFSRNDIDLDFALCNRENLTPKLASLLAGSSFEAVRKLIAARTDLSTDIYQLLATDSAMLVRDAIRENQACSPEIRALAALGSL